MVWNGRCTPYGVAWLEYTERFWPARTEWRAGPGVVGVGRYRALNERRLRLLKFFDRLWTECEKKNPKHPMMAFQEWSDRCPK